MNLQSKVIYYIRHFHINCFSCRERGRAPSFCLADGAKNHFRNFYSICVPRNKNPVREHSNLYISFSFFLNACTRKVTNIPLPKANSSVEHNCLPSLCLGHFSPEIKYCRKHSRIRMVCKAKTVLELCGFEIHCHQMSFFELFDAAV